MASIISIASFLILLLATFSYSVPVGVFYGNSTTDYQYTTGQPMFYEKQLVNVVFRPSNNSANTTVVITDVSTEYFNSNEVSQLNVTRPPRGAGSSDESDFEDLSDGNYEESSVPSSTQASGKRALKDYSPSSEIESAEKRSDDKSEASSAEETNKRSAEEPLPSSSNEKRATEDSSSSSIEETDKRSSAEFGTPSSNFSSKRQPSYRKPFKTILPKGRPSGYNASSKAPLRRTGVPLASDQVQTKRAVDNDFSSSMESSAEFNQRAIRPLESGEVVESSTSFSAPNQTETNTVVMSFTSVETFGNYTGLFFDGQNSTSEYQTTEAPSQGSQLTKTVSVIPGQITQTRLSGNPVNKFAQPLQHDQQQQQQLSQVQNQ